MTENNPQSQPITLGKRNLPALAEAKKQAYSHSQCYFIHKGVLSITTHHGRYFIPEQHAIIIPSDCAHAVIAITAVQLSLVTVNTAQAGNITTQSSIFAITPLMNALIDESDTLTVNYAWESTQGRVLRLLRDKMCNIFPVDIFLPYPKDQRLKSITNRLLQHPSLKTDLVSWGKFVKASPRTLSRVFKKETHITYSEWRQRLNVQTAVKYLSQGECISNIAQLLGYESSSSFIYMFKKQMGISPNQFLKS